MNKGPATDKISVAGPIYKIFACILHEVWD